jgi:inorganic pyrophosphatase
MSKFELEMNQLQYQVFDVINDVRTFPASLVKELEEMLKHYSGKTYINPKTKKETITSEGIEAVKEAIEFLKVNI